MYISSKVRYKNCVSARSFYGYFLCFTLQAVKRSHRRLGLAQKLMEQVYHHVVFTAVKLSPALLYYKLFVKFIIWRTNL